MTFTKAKSVFCMTKPFTSWTSQFKTTLQPDMRKDVFKSAKAYTLFAKNIPLTLVTMNIKF